MKSELKAQPPLSEKSPWLTSPDDRRTTSHRVASVFSVFGSAAAALPSRINVTCRGSFPTSHTSETPPSRTGLQSPGV